MLSGEAKSSHISVKVRSQDDICVYFRVKKDVALRALMEGYSVKVGKEMSSLVFTFDGNRINPNQTPNELDLGDKDEIDVFGHQSGGGFSFYRR